MKKLLMAAVALGAVASSPAIAAVDSTATYEVSGTVNASCNATSGTAINFGTIATSSTDGTLTANQSQTSAGSDVFCNGVNSTITISGTAITTAQTDTADFTSTLNFLPTAAITGNSPLSLTIPSGSTSATTAFGARAGNLKVTTNALTASGGKRPFAGTYNGNVTVTLSPAV